MDYKELLESSVGKGRKHLDWITLSQSCLQRWRPSATMELHIAVSKPNERRDGYSTLKKIVCWWMVDTLTILWDANRDINNIN